jgi:hypothetical protein
VEDVNKVRRDHIEKLADEIDGTPDPGWEKMEETVREVRARGGESNHPTDQESKTGTEKHSTR